MGAFKNKAIELSELKSDYFRVITERGDDSADIYLYGYIGQMGFDASEDITDIAVVKAIRELEGYVKRINIRINSPGGSVLHGDPIVTAIKNSKAEIHTYVDGMAASMAFDIWVSSKNRHASAHSKLMVHATSTIAFGTAKDMRAAADMLDKFDETSIASFSAATGMSEDETRTRYYDYEDHWMTAKDAFGMGLIAEVEDYAVASAMAEPEKMSFRQLLANVARMDYAEQTEAEPKGQPDPQKQEQIQDTWREAYLTKRGLLFNKTITKV
jgi:ATP-dependent protease ClpP protease subunit